MVREHTSEEHGAADSESFEQWLDQAAESKGVSRQELMNQMLSSYWILDELTGLIGETGAEATAGHRSPGPSESASVRDDETQQEDEADVEDASTAEGIHEIQAAIRELIEKQALDERRQTDGDAFDRPPVFDEGVVAVVSDLQRQVGRFDGDLEEIGERQNAQFDRLSNELQLLLDRVGELEREQDRFATADDLNALAGDLEAVTERVQEVWEANESLESRVDREFDSIEELFRRLLDAVDELDSDLDASTATYRNRHRANLRAYLET